MKLKITTILVLTIISIGSFTFERNIDFPIALKTTENQLNVFDDNFE